MRISLLRPHLDHYKLLYEDFYDDVNEFFHPCSFYSKIVKPPVFFSEMVSTLMAYSSGYELRVEGPSFPNRSIFLFFYTPIL